MTPHRVEAIEIFCSYAHKDESLREEMEAHLSSLKREGKIKNWHDRLIKSGENWRGKIDEHLERAHIILLLISADFIKSDYCHEIEMQRAMQRYRAKEARVIPIILRSCDWETSPFGELQALPKGAVPVTEWSSSDIAFTNIAKGIRLVVDELLAAASTVSASPKIQTTTIPPQSIPRPPTVGFVVRRNAEGRDIVEQLREELAPEKNQLMALCGAGGVGKTTLAAESVRELREEFAHRVAWVSADGRPDFSLSTLLDEITGQLGHPEMRPLPLEQKDEQLRAIVAIAPTLIVLDNFETIAEVEQTRCAGWLANSVSCSAVVTSRDEVPYACPVNIDAMPVPEAREFVGRLIRQARHPQSFKGLEHDQIINAADRTPLVLQWIIKQIDHAKQPRTVLSELAHGKGDAAERVFGRSFDLLSDDGRAALLALSLFVPSASRPALAEVAGFGQDTARLDAAAAQMAELWLATLTEGNERLIVEGLTRELAKNLLATDGRAAEFRQRFIGYFQSYAEAHARPMPEDYDVLEAERNNLLAAMDIAFEAAHWKAIIRIRAALEEFLDVRGHWDESVQRGEQAVTAAYSDQNEAAAAMFAMNIATVRRRRGEYVEAKRALTQAVNAFRKLGDEPNVAVGLHKLAAIMLDEGKLEEARQLFDDSLEINRRLGKQGGIANTLYNLAAIAQKQGEFESARQLYGVSLEINKRLNNQSYIANTLHALGCIAQDKGELEEARRLYEESLEVNKRFGNQRGIAACLHELGIVCLDEGDIEGSENLLNQSLYILKKLDYKQYIAECLESIGRLRIAQGLLAAARESFNESLDMALSIGDKFRVACVKRSLGLLAEKQNEKAKAAELWRAALSVFESLKSPKAADTRRDLERLEKEVS